MTTVKDVLTYEDTPKPTALVDQHFAQVASLTKKLDDSNFWQSMRYLGGPGSGNFGHAGRPGQVGGSAEEFVEAYRRESARQRARQEHTPSLRVRQQGVKPLLADLVLHHSSNDESVPSFAAFFGDQSFIEGFGKQEFGQHTFEATLPKGTQVIDLNIDSPATREFKATMAEHAWPEDTDFHAQLRRGEGDYDDFYETWTDKKNILAVLQDMPNVVARYQGEYLIPKSLIYKIPIVRTLGGPGSGNFGHSGRPGEVGGSTTVFHGTIEDHRASIKKNGLQATHAGAIWPEFSKPGHVYATTELGDAIRWANSAAAHSMIPKEGSPRPIGQMAVPVVFEIEVPDDDTRMQPDEHFVQSNDYEIAGDIPPEWIKKVWVLKKGVEPNRQGLMENWKRRNLAGFRRLYVPLALLVDEFEALGGVGSGNFGHAGRPGEVGGSAVTFADIYEMMEQDPARYQQVLGKSSFPFFHGTTNQAVESIKKNGLVPKGGRGADVWAIESPKTMVVHPKQMMARPPAVFLAEGLEDARMFAEYAKEVNPGTEPVVLKIEVPVEEFPDLLEDEFKHWAWRYLDKIPPKWIAGKVDKDGKVVALAKGGKKIVFYAVVLVDNEPTALGGAGSGNFGHAGRPGEVGGSGPGAEGSTKIPTGHVGRPHEVGGSGPGGEHQARSVKAQRALKAFKPIHALAQRYAEKNELAVREMVGGTRTDDNSPVDVITEADGHTIGVEVKTMINNTNDKITVRRDAVQKKEAWARKHRAALHTVVIDDRGKLGHPAYSGHRLYHMKGTGSFRLASMTPVRDAKHLQELLAA